VKSQYYHVSSDGGSYDAEILLRELELRFEVYNRLFRVNAASLNGPLRVRSFLDKPSYDKYVMDRLGTVRDGAVYLHYNQPERRELVVLRGSAEESRMLPHQAFIQYLRAFVPQPPTWMREGFAIYFNTVRFDKNSRELKYEENLAWLETVKNLGVNVPTLDAILLSDVRSQPEYFQPVSWALVSFFLNAGSNSEYFRTLTEAFMLLRSDFSASENSNVIYDRIFRWTSVDRLTADYNAYIATRRTFAELVDAGQRAYAAHDNEAARAYFEGALYQKPTHYAPYYYLGLLAYENGHFDRGEVYYRSSLQYGADAALVNYALGINAASAGRNSDARNYLQNAINLAPDRYKERAEQIIARLGVATGLPQAQ
jgi:tetratricopeptide (TPR) repeat protein